MLYSYSAYVLEIRFYEYDYIIGYYLRYLKTNYELQDIKNVYLEYVYSQKKITTICTYNMHTVGTLAMLSSFRKLLKVKIDNCCIV